MKVRTQQTGGTLPQSEDDNIDIDDLVDSNATSEPVTAPTPPRQKSPIQLTPKPCIKHHQQTPDCSKK